MSRPDERAYPIRPRPDDDTRFTFGLVLDVAEVLERHSYPQASANDVLELRQTLYRFLYEEADR